MCVAQCWGSCLGVQGLVAHAQVLVAAWGFIGGPRPSPDLKAHVTAKSPPQLTRTLTGLATARPMAAQLGTLFRTQDGEADITPKLRVSHNVTLPRSLSLPFSSFSSLTKKVNKLVLRFSKAPIAPSPWSSAARTHTGCSFSPLDVCPP